MLGDCVLTFDTVICLSYASLKIVIRDDMYMEIGRHRGITANAHIKIGSNAYEKVKTFKYLGSLLTNQNYVQEEIKCTLKAGNSCYYSVQTLLSYRLLSKNLKIKIYKTIVFASCFIWL